MRNNNLGPRCRYHSIFTHEKENELAKHSTYFAKMLYVIIPLELRKVIFPKKNGIKHTFNRDK